MLALLAANAYLGIEDANLQHFYWFLCALAMLAVCLIGFRLIGLFFAAQREKKASWTTFRLLAKTRDLSDPQINVLAIVVRYAQIKRPPRILGSIQLLDKAVQKAQERIEFSESQMLLIDSTRKKLVSSKVRWTANSDERRQVERAHCSWNARMIFIAKEILDKEMLKVVGDESERLKGALAEVSAGRSDNNLKEYKVQIRDISGGGGAFLASPTFPGVEGDYVMLYGESQRIPFALENLCGEILSIEKDDERGCVVIHNRFLLLDQEVRKGIINYVYGKITETDNKGTSSVSQAIARPT
jgi:hypothetical protein